MFETLESRRLFSGSVLLKGGSLLVDGTDQADTLDFGVDATFIHVVLNGASRRFDRSRVEAIRIDTGAGDDRIILGTKLKIGALIYAGNGNDTVSGGAGDDTIFGQAGNDDLSGRIGNDYLDGGSGDDQLDDYLGRNVIHGGSGRDSAIEDSGLLGSGVESRQMLLIFDTNPPSSQLYSLTSSTGTGTDLFEVSGRLILEYSGVTGSVSNGVRFSDVTRRTDGQDQVQVIVTTPPYGSGSLAAIKTYTHRWDVTDAAKHGLVFQIKTIVPGSRSAGVGTVQTHHSSPLLLPSALANPS